MLWLVSRTDAVDWQEHRDVVVRAGSGAEALRMVTCGFVHPDGCEYRFSGYRRDGSNARVVEILPDGGPAIICEEFTAV